MLSEWRGNSTKVSTLVEVCGCVFECAEWRKRFRWKQSTGGRRWKDSCFAESCSELQLVHQQRSEKPNRSERVKAFKQAAREE